MLIDCTYSNFVQPPKGIRGFSGLSEVRGLSGLKLFEIGVLIFQNIVLKLVSLIFCFTKLPS